METLLGQLDRRLQKALSHLDELPGDFDARVTQAADLRYGDYQTNAAMTLARPLKQNPREIAGQIIQHLEVADLSREPEIAGAGFINFWIKPEALGTHLQAMAGDDRLGVPLTTDPRTIVIDFASPNVAKAMHIGHIRSTVIGDALSRIARFLGHDVITDNHIGDWGTQFGMVIYGFKHELNREALKDDPMAEVVRVYRAVNALCKEDEQVKEACRRELVKLQQGDEENYAIWQESIDLSMQDFRQIFERLDVEFDYVLGESAYNDDLGPLVERLLDTGIAEVSEGAVIVAFPENERLQDKPCLIRKSDGGFLYATTDLATLNFRRRQFGADEAWVVVGAPQALHFEQVNAVAEKIAQLEGAEVPLTITHVAFGSILGADGKLMRTRSGDNVLLKDVLNEARERAQTIVDEKNPDMPQAERDEIAEILGIGSIKYFELSQNRLSDYKFDWETMLSFTGNTFPYLANAYVRIRSIFRRAGEVKIHPGKSLILEEDAEMALGKKLAQFGETLPQVLSDHKPNVLSNYLYELANTFHTFYEHCPVLRSEGDVLNTRLMLCDLTCRTLKAGLGLLGISVPERM